MKCHKVRNLDIVSTKSAEPETDMCQFMIFAKDRKNVLPRSELEAICLSRAELLTGKHALRLEHVLR